MIKRFYKLFPALFIVSDLLVLSGILCSAALIDNAETTIFDPTSVIFWLSSLVLWTVISLFAKDYKIGRNSHYSKSLARGFRSVIVYIAVVSFLLVFINYQDFPRETMALFFGFMLIVLPSYRIVIHMILIRYRRYGGNFRLAVIIGYDDLGISLFDTLHVNQDLGIRCVGFYGEGKSADSKYPVLGSTEDFFNSNLEKLDFIYVSDHVDKLTLNRIIELADDEFKKVKLLPHFKTDYLKTYSLRAVEQISVIDVNSLPLDSLLNRFVKRSFDIVFSFIVTLFILSWLYPLIALIIKLESPGPAIFKQLRHGKNNRQFTCLKFRTMVMNEVADSKWATRNDPRVTRFGAFLRKTSLDELPQFINVLRGEMAIVGPRPLPIQMNNVYKYKIDKFLQRHAYKPGITGLAQSMGYRGEIRELSDIKKRVKLDRFYFQNWTFFFDIKIILVTIGALIRGQETAY